MKVGSIFGCVPVIVSSEFCVDELDSKHRPHSVKNWEKTPSILSIALIETATVVKAADEAIDCPDINNFPKDSLDLSEDIIWLPTVPKSPLERRQNHRESANSVGRFPPVEKTRRRAEAHRWKRFVPLSPYEIGINIPV